MLESQEAEQKLYVGRHDDIDWLDPGHLRIVRHTRFETDMFIFVTYITGRKILAPIRGDRLRTGIQRHPYQAQISCSKCGVAASHGMHRKDLRNLLKSGSQS